MSFLDHSKSRNAIRSFENIDIIVQLAGSTGRSRYACSSSRKERFLDIANPGLEFVPLRSDRANQPDVVRGCFGLPGFTDRSESISQGGHGAFFSLCQHLQFQQSCVIPVVRALSNPAENRVSYRTTRMMSSLYSSPWRHRRSDSR